MLDLPSVGAVAFHAIILKHHPGHPGNLHRANFIHVIVAVAGGTRWGSLRQSRPSLQPPKREVDRFPCRA